MPLVGRHVFRYVGSPRPLECGVSVRRFDLRLMNRIAGRVYGTHLRALASHELRDDEAIDQAMCGFAMAKHETQPRRPAKLGPPSARNILPKISQRVLTGSKEMCNLRTLKFKEFFAVGRI